MSTEVNTEVHTSSIRSEDNGLEHKDGIQTSNAADLAKPKKPGFWAKLSGGKDKSVTGKDKSKPEKEPTVSFAELFRFADKFDRILLVFGTIAACCAGVGMPLLTLIFSNLFGVFLDFNNSDTENNEAIRHHLDHETRRYSLYFMALGLAMWTVASIQKLFWSLAAERISRRLREAFYVAILRQDIGWFDSLSTGELTTRISGDVNMVQDGTGEKFGFIIQYVSTFVSALILAFVKGWRLTLVVLAVLPLLVGSASLIGIILARSTAGGQDAYAEAGGVADEVLSSIKTVMAFGGHERELKRYTKKLGKAKSAGLFKACVVGCNVGFMMFAIYSLYSLGFWYGGKLAREGKMDPSTVLNVFFALIIGGFSLGNSAPSITAVTSARGAAVKVYQIIDRKSPIDSVQTENGISAENIAGEIELCNVDFSYPTRKDVQVLNNFSILVKPGQKVALVGESGCGKSTMIGLVERFYDADSGVVKLDGVDVREYNVRSLRQQIGVIMQMPVLFGYSIYQNIIWGAADVENNPPTKEQVIQACKDANAHDFISQLPDGYETMCGERGALLSGGQKQRIAIARALVRNPKILLLDEATSALDTSAERVVQEALDRASADRTTITVAHRLSTIRDSDVIYVIGKGHVLEHGNHEELIAKNGAYARLVEAQQIRQALETDVSKLEASSDSPESIDAAKIGGSEDVSAVSGYKNEKDVDDLTDPSQGGVPVERANTHRSMLRRFSVQRTSTGMSADRLSTTSTENGGKEQGDDLDPESEEGKKLLEKRDQEMRKRGLSALPRLIRMNKKYTGMLIPGVIFTVIDGAAFPCFSLVFARMLVAMAIPDKDKQKHEVNLYAGMFFLFAGVMLVVTTGRNICFNWASEKITFNVRHDVFKAMMRQDAAYFDRKENGVGALTARLATEANEVCRGIGDAFPAFIAAFASIVTGIAIAFVYDWHLTLVILGMLPFFTLAFYFEGKSMYATTKTMKGAYEKASQEASETVSNIRTVATLTREHTFIAQFKQNSEGPYRSALKNHFISSVSYGFAQATMFLVYSLAFFVGSQFILKGFVTVQEMFNVMYAIVFAAFALGLMAQQSSVLTKALISSEKLLGTILSVPKIDAQTEDGVRMSNDDVRGDITLSRVSFAYPTRPRARILHHVSLGVTPGKTIALVGPSGSGKSTVIALVQRLYDVISGSVEVEGTDVRQWNVESLRQNLALVGQEPVLFDYTIAENIEYGRPGATQAEIEAVAKQANIHGFVSELPDGYNTRIGQTGGQLSGGQKQRIAIARALVRNPKILLLDEASSALDSQSEKLVQEALELAAEGRTTITIAHRLSTIQNADMIVVFRQGRIVEHGTHDELIEQKGLYSLLVTQQSLEITH
ncbi:hypothetical protein GGI25_005282, partial [Coemansia spiralis]|uniref:P-loop containing nucleoside triphosphate hydrolase protein n=2 Tax=Coemansia TaxID=4863 RepID=A0ABQ8PG07_9FUNG